LKKSGPTSWARAFRFVPSGRAHLSGHGPWFDVLDGRDRPITPATPFRFRGDGGGLPHHGLFDHVPRDRLPELNGDLFKVGELGSPGQAFGPIDPLDEVFCDALEVVLQVRHDDRLVLGLRHPWLLARVASRAAA
jgi:hypothetical protein